MELCLQHIVYNVTNLIKVTEIKQNTVSVKLYEGEISDGDIQKLGIVLSEILPRQFQPFCFEITNENIENDNVTYVLGYLKHIQTQFSLRLNIGEIGCGELLALKTLLENNVHLTCLRITHGVCEKNKFSFLLIVISFNKTLKTLRAHSEDLYGVSLSNEYCRLFSNNRTLTTLDLRGSDYIKFTKEMAEALISNTTLTNLDLSSTGMEPEDYHHVAEVLRRTNTLSTLWLSNNKMGNACMDIIVNSVIHNTSLTELNLSNNSSYRSGFISLNQLFQHNTSLRSLNLSGNMLGILLDSPQISLFTQGLGSLNHLDLGECNLGSKEISELGIALKTNTDLCSLNLSGNRFYKKNARVFADMLASNTTLENLKLDNNIVTNSNFLIITEGISKNNTLLELDIITNHCMEANTILYGLQKIITPRSNLVDLSVRCGIFSDQEHEILLNCLSLNSSLLCMNACLRMFHPIQRKINDITSRNKHNKKMKEITLFERLLENTSQFALTKQTFFDN